MNNVNLVGRLVKAPETRGTAGDTLVTELRLVTERTRVRNGKTERDANGYLVKDAEFHRVIAFNGMGKAVADHKKQGDMLAVTGRIHYTKWTDQDGNDRYGCEIIADDIQFI